MFSRYDLWAGLALPLVSSAAVLLAAWRATHRRLGQRAGRSWSAGVGRPSETGGSGVACSSTRGGANSWALAELSAAVSVAPAQARTTAARQRRCVRWSISPLSVVRVEQV